MARIRRVLETALYVDDLERARAFYCDLLGLEAMSGSERFVALDAGQATVLLLFLRGASTSDMETAHGVIPGHDSVGPAHLALAIDSADLDPWRERLARNGVPLDSEVLWPRGGTSLYVRDPDGHCVELATPGVWPTY